MSNKLTFLFEPSLGSHPSGHPSDVQNVLQAILSLNFALFRATTHQNATVPYRAPGEERLAQARARLAGWAARS